MKPASDLGTGKSKDKQEEFLSQIIAKLNELFDTDDRLNYAHTVTDKVRENTRVMK
ncbi:hypothetical protein GCM10007094_10710 [Pseudovibrio japonicus]|uniref:Uncharacterized protein n=1 Tax=Pseudovibrio japonicus TaxID=366534 RepID=A0ABQ3E3D7_9HYPH|nr:hypothetical protein [Pseudovibrio japonicus]GHB24520.1 hypothetical protein GCM10007094_10710 [Pseudovibrio japonicus]